MRCSVVTQKHFTTWTELPSPNDNISVPMGLYKSVEHYLGSTGVLEYLDLLKAGGIPLSKILTAVCTHILMGCKSMNRCSEWLQNKDVSTELGLDSGLSQRTINRIVLCAEDVVKAEVWEVPVMQFSVS